MIEEKTNEKIKTWVCPVDFDSMHRKARSLCQPGTGAWFIHGPFKSWIETTSKCRLLSLEGKCESSDVECRDMLTRISGIRKDCPMVGISWELLTIPVTNLHQLYGNRDCQRCCCQPWLQSSDLLLLLIPLEFIAGAGLPARSIAGTAI
jgi:hypothetical protein